MSSKNSKSSKSRPAEEAQYTTLEYTGFDPGSDSKTQFLTIGEALLIEGLADMERHLIEKTLGEFNGHRQRTAESLGIGVRTLGMKLKKWKSEQNTSLT